MRLGTTRWLLVGLLGLGLWPMVAASAQETRWDNLNKAATEAYQHADYAKAEELLLAALQEAEKFGEQDPRLATILNNLALLYYTLDKYAEADLLWRRALAIREEVLGPEHPQVATSLNNLAELYRAQGNYAQAEPLYQRALAIFEKALGPDHSNMATSLENYAVLLRKMGRDAEADKREARAKAIRAKHAEENPLK